MDHIDPIADINGNPLNKQTLIERIWTDKIQVLDKTCHFLKSKEENKQRRKNKIDKKKKRR